MKVGDLIDGQALPVVDLLWRAEFALQGPDVVERVTSFGLPDAHDAQSCRHRTQRVEKFPVPFERCPVRHHDDVYVAILRRTRLVGVGMQPVARQRFQAAQPWMECLNLRDFIVVACLYKKGIGRLRGSQCENVIPGG